MIRTLSLEEDLELKRFASTSKEKKPRFNWRDVLLDERLVQPEIIVQIGGEEKDFDLAEVADTIGTALTDLLLSRRQEDNIFTEKNQGFVAGVSKEVGRLLAAQRKDNEQHPHTRCLRRYAMIPASRGLTSLIFVLNPSSYLYPCPFPFLWAFSEGFDADRHRHA